MFFRILLMNWKDAVIADITAHMPNCQYPAMASFTHFKDVEFT